MGNQTSLNSLSVGEVVFSKDLALARISCILPKAAVVNVIVQDIVGRSRIEEKFSLEKGNQVISLNITHLSEGSYNAWISLIDKTFLRNFQVKKASNNGNWISKLKNYFN